MHDDGNGDDRTRGDQRAGDGAENAAHQTSGGAPNPIQPPHPLHSTEHGLSDLLNDATERRFGLPELAVFVTFAAFALAFAWWLASATRWFELAASTDVVGALSAMRHDKGFETRLFVLTTCALPTFVWLAAWWLQTRRNRGESGPPSSWWWLSAAASIAGLFQHATQVDRLSGFGFATIAATAMLGPLGAGVERWFGRREGRARRGPADAATAGWADRLNGPGAELVLSAAALTIAVLALGPRTAPNAPLLTSILRVGGAFACSFVALWGVCSVLGAGLGDRAFVLSRPFVALAALRFVRADDAMLVGIVLGGCAVAAAIVGAWVLRNSANGASTTAPPMRSRFAWNVAAPWLVVALVFHFGVHGTIDLFHSGEWLTIGAMTREGMTPFRDLYLQHGLVQNALRAAWTMQWIGDSLWADRVTTNVLYGVTHAAFFWMLLPILRSPYVALLAALAFATRGMFLQPRFLPMFIAVACLLRAIDATHRDVAEQARARRHVLLAGIAAGIGVFWSLDIGVYTTLAAGLYFVLDAWLSRRRTPLRRGLLQPLSHFALGAGLGAAPFVLYLGAHGALGAFVENSRLQASLQLPVWGLPFPSLREWLATAGTADPKEFLGNGTFIAFVAPLVFVVALAVVLVRARTTPLGARDKQRALLALLGLVVFRTALGRSDAGHFAYAAAFVWPIALMAAQDGWRARPTRGLVLRLAPACVLVGYLFTAFEPAYALVRQWSRISEIEPDVPGGGFSYAPPRRMRDVLVPDAQAQTLTALKAWLDERLPPGEPFADFCNAGAAYYFVERPIASRYAYPAYAATPAMQREFIADLERTRPRYLLASKVIGGMDVDGVLLESRLPLLTAYFKANYEPCADEVFGTMLRRKGDLAPR